MVVTVYVWRGRWNKKDWTGHSALAVEPDSLYLSYWPRRGGPRSRKAAPKKNALEPRDATWSDELGEDVQHIGYRPTGTVTLRNLNEPTIRECWESAKLGRFDILSMNCSTVVGRALLKSYQDALEDDWWLKVKVAKMVLPQNSFDAMLMSMSDDTIWYPSQVLRFANLLKRLAG